MSSDPLYVEVAFPLPLDRTFHYAVVSNGVPSQALGARIMAPFGKQRNLVGYVVGQTDQKPAFPTKPIAAWLDESPIIDQKLLDLARWMSGRYLCSLGEALACVVPPRLLPPKRPGRTESIDRPLDHRAATLHLSSQQKNVLEKLIESVDASAFRPFLLRGITDSGKTEIYVRVIDHALALGKQALFLLPEIALTPPFIDRLTQRYSGPKFGLWHSGLPEGERYQTWTKVRRGEIQILLGARSAVFAPFPNLGVIVMDEEHEPTYKQEDRPRYHTRDVALKRAEMTKSILLMGSATPSLESYWSAKQGIYTLLELTSRVEARSLPPVELIDRRPKTAAPPAAGRRARSASFSVFSEPLHLAIERRLARREQIMLFVNRRGFTPFLRCSTCGWVARCSRCSTTLALHHAAGPRSESRVSSNAGPSALEPRASPFMQCHACLHREPVPIQCPACKGMRLHQYGIGTERVEEELKKLFPFVKVARLDRDIAASRKVYERIYRSFAGGELDVLVGTQMIAKGFDFPRVTLVGVVDADVGLHRPDFRSAERTFDLITQVAGRAGRGEVHGKVLVQTHHPEHYALQAAQAHDYLQFYDQELRYREGLNYPPFCRLVNVLVRGSKEAVVHQSADDLAAKLQALGAGAEILGPAPAPYSRLRNQFRYQILLKGSEASLQPFLDFLRRHRLPKAFMSVDVDPMDLL